MTDYPRIGQAVKNAHGTRHVERFPAWADRGKYRMVVLKVIAEPSVPQGPNDERYGL